MSPSLSPRLSIRKTRPRPRHPRSLPTKLLIKAVLKKTRTTISTNKTKMTIQPLLIKLSSTSMTRKKKRQFSGFSMETMERTKGKWAKTKKRS